MKNIEFIESMKNYPIDFFLIHDAKKSFGSTFRFYSFMVVATKLEKV